MIRVLGLGDNVVDKYMHISTMYPGGNALNFAVYAKALGFDAGYMGVFGDDEAAKHVYHTAEKLGLDLSHVRFYPGENGYAQVKLENGDRVFMFSNKGGVSKEHLLELTKLDKEYIAGFDIIHTSIFSHIENQLPAIRETADFISMDFSDGLDDEYLRRCAPYLDCACISCGNMEEAAIMVQIEKIIGYGCKHMVIATRGVNGAFLMADGRVYEQSPNLVPAIDTMGAGDSFITCFLVNYVSGMKNAVDFPSGSAKKGIVTRLEYQNLLIRTSLYRAALFSAENCLKEGSFGYGELFEKGEKIYEKKI